MIIKGTSCYANAKSGNLVSITGDGGNAWGFYGNAYKKMSPRLYLWQYYDQNPDNLAEDELINWYIKEFYNLRLKKAITHLNFRREFGYHYENICLKKKIMI